MDPDKRAEAQFCEHEACGERYSDDQDGIRYEPEPEILRVVDFASARGQRVLEIWVGMGAVGEPAGGRRPPLVQQSVSPAKPSSERAS